MGKKRKKSGEISKDKPKVVVQEDKSSSDNGLPGQEPFDVSQIGTPVILGEESETFLSASDLLQRDYSELPSQVLQSSLNEIEPLDLSTISENIVFDDSLSNAWDAMKENQSFQETLKSTLLEGDLQKERDYWKTLLKDESNKFNVSLKSTTSFQDWVEDNRDSLDINWDQILEGPKSLDLDSLATATASAARYIRFFDDLDEDRRYLTLSDDGMLQIPGTELVEAEEEADTDESDNAADEEVVDLRPDLAALSKSTQSLPLGLLMVAARDKKTSLAQFGLDIGILPESAARALIQSVVDERVRQNSDDKKWNMQLFAAGALILGAIIGAIITAAL